MTGWSCYKGRGPPGFSSISSSTVSCVPTGGGNWSSLATGSFFPPLTIPSVSCGFSVIARTSCRPKRYPLLRSGMSLAFRPCQRHERASPSTRYAAEPRTISGMSVRLRWLRTVSITRARSSWVASRLAERSSVSVRVQATDAILRTCRPHQMGSRSPPGAAVPGTRSPRDACTRAPHARIERRGHHGVRTADNRGGLRWPCALHHGCDGVVRALNVRSGTSSSAPPRTMRIPLPKVTSTCPH